MDSTLLAEYKQARESCALFDLSSRAKVEVSGAEAAMFLHNLCTNDINNMPIGAGCESFLATSTAKAIAFVNVYHFLAQNDREAFWIDSEPGSEQRILQHLDKHLISEQAEFADRTQQFAQFHLAGPTADVVLERALLDDVPELDQHLHMIRTFGEDMHCHIRRIDTLGLPGFDIVCLAELGPRVGQHLLQAGAKALSESTREILRIEAGTPVYGTDIDEKRFVVEVDRRDKAISFEKGCYLGQEPIVMSRDRGQVQRRLMGVVVDGEETLPSGTKLMGGEKEAGQTTSSVWSPKLESVIALAYIRRNFQDAESLQTEDGRQTKVVELPFV